MVLVPYADDDVAEVHDHNKRYHCRQPHLRLADTVVPLRQLRGDPVAERASGHEADDGADDDGEVGVADFRGGEVVRWGGEGLRLREVERQEGRAGPGDDEAGELDDRKDHDLPRSPKVDEHALEGRRIWREWRPLLLVRLAAAEERVALCGLCERESCHLGIDGRRGRKTIVKLRAALLLRVCSRALEAFLAHNLRWVETVPFRLWVRTGDQDNCCAQKSDVEPPEATKAYSLCHWTGNNRRDHEGAHIGDPIGRNPFATVIQEEEVSDDSWLDCLCWTSAKAIESGVLSVGGCVCVMGS